MMRRQMVQSQPPDALPVFTAQASRWRTRRVGGLLVAVAVLTIGICFVWAMARDGEPPVFGYRVVNTYPHDPQAYCQGLVVSGDVLYEGTGKFGESTLRQVELATGKVLRSVPLDRQYFGEGITILNDRIYQLTWKNRICFVYDLQTFQQVDSFRLAGEGWGLTHDGTHLILSDGSSTLSFLDPKTGRVVRRLLVQGQGRRVAKLNELEYVNGEIFANIWYEDYIARINPKNGQVVGWIDLRTLMPGRADREAVLNGIAYDSQRDRLFVTGKNWPKLFEIKIEAP
jgi:glutamine cyclotransferase